MTDETPDSIDIKQKLQEAVESTSEQPIDPVVKDLWARDGLGNKPAVPKIDGSDNDESTNDLDGTGMSYLGDMDTPEADELSETAGDGGA